MDRIKYDTGVYDTEYFSKVNMWRYDPSLYREKSSILEDCNKDKITKTYESKRLPMNDHTKVNEADVQEKLRR